MNLRKKRILMLKLITLTIIGMLLFLAGCSEDLTCPPTEPATYTIVAETFVTYGYTYNRFDDLTHCEFTQKMAEYMQLTGPSYLYKIFYYTSDNSDHIFVCEDGVWIDCSMQPDHDHHYCGCLHCVTCRPENHSAGN